MKKMIALMLCLVFVLSMVGCTKEKETPPFDAIKDSVAAKLEEPNGNSVIVDSEIDSLKALGDMEFAILEDPDAMKTKWLYCITYNPTEKVINGTEIKVFFYSDYIKIGDKCYVPSDDAVYKEILSWTKSKFDYFIK